MDNDLNKKYFDTKRKHNNSYNKRGYLIWIIIGIGILVCFVGREIITSQRKKETAEKKTKEFMEQGVLSKGDTLIISRSTGTKILVLENCLFKELETNFASIKFDSSGLTCIVKRIIPDPEYSSSIIQWEKQIKETEPSYEFKDITRDSTESKIIESANVRVLGKENRKMKGIVRIIKTGGLYYVTNIVTYENYWDKLSTDIARIFDSIEIIE